MANSPPDPGSEPSGKSWDISNWLAREVASPPAEAAPAQAPNAVQESAPPAPEKVRVYPRKTVQESAAETTKPAPRTRKGPKALLILLLIGLSVPALFFLSAGNRLQPSTPPSTQNTEAPSKTASAPALTSAADKPAVAARESAPLPAQASSDGKTDTKSTAAKTESAKPVQPEPAAKKDPTADPSAALAIKKGLKDVNVRADPSVNKPPIAKLNGGDRVEKILEEGAWLRIRFTVDGAPDEGWIRKDLVQGGGK